MGYITKEQVQEIRQTLKSTFPKTKFSITRVDYSGVRIVIRQSDVNFDVEYKQVNEYYIDKNYTGSQRDMLKTIRNVASKGVTYRETGDYGHQPSHYIWINIGEYDRHFQYTGN
mgnify:CR=1 FL=1